ncbi:hypothetical protein MKW98_004420 [Papaver atlanticum]|uniref:Uncharacterized protein n=1 Tax=Papaver atlanticum TaxID=357466 RepID=A0AAD4SPN3_9MAGN|nr:hypothetical protein MKW98_004420 [Papaver atlanticum]
MKSFHFHPSNPRAEDTVFYAIYPDESFQASSSKTPNPDETDQEFSSSSIYSLTPLSISGNMKLSQIVLKDQCCLYPPNWLNPETSKNRAFIRRGELNIESKQSFPLSPKLIDSIPRLNMHQVRVRVPVSIAKVLKYETCLISLAIESFYDKDVDSLKYAAKMEKFVSGGTSEENFQQTFQAPKCYSMPSRNDASVYVEAEMGMKIACGFEMMYEQRRHENLDGKGTSTWEAFKESLGSSGYLKNYFLDQKNVDSWKIEMMSAPVRRIDEIFALPHSSEEVRRIYDGENELKLAMVERERERERKSQKVKEYKDADCSAESAVNDSDLGDIVNSMQSFVQKVLSYEGVEVPTNRNSDMVDLDVERFMKDIESVMDRFSGRDDADLEGESSSDMEFDKYFIRILNFCDLSEGDDTGNTFTGTFSDALNEELKSTTLKKSFGSSLTNVVMEVEDEELTPVDVDVNLVKILDSFSSQQGLPGPASNLLVLTGLQLPQPEMMLVLMQARRMLNEPSRNSQVLR